MELDHDECFSLELAVDLHGFSESSCQVQRRLVSQSRSRQCDLRVILSRASLFRCILDFDVYRGDTGCCPERKDQSPWTPSLLPSPLSQVNYVRHLLHVRQTPLQDSFSEILSCTKVRGAWFEAQGGNLCSSTHFCLGNPPISLFTFDWNWGTALV